jgi:hypothetical protein
VPEAGKILNFETKKEKVKNKLNQLLNINIIKGGL